MPLEMAFQERAGAAGSDLYRALLEALPDAFVAVDEAGRVAEWSHRAEETFGWKAADVIGKSADDLGLPAHRLGQVEPGLPCFVTRHEKTGRAGLRQLRAMGSDGKDFPVEINVVERVLSGQTRFLCLIKDVSQRVIGEERLAQAEKMEAIGQLTGGLAHDFNNILGIVIGSLETLLNRGGDEEQRELLELAMLAAERGTEVTQSLQAVARRRPLVPRRVDINQAIREMAPLLERSGNASFRLAVAAEADRESVMIDVGSFNNVLLNFVINARDAMPGGGDVLVYTQNVTLTDGDSLDILDLDPGHYVVVGVDDNGQGMTAEVLSHAIEPFFTTKARGKGTGLGLAMAYAFARQCGGALRIRSEPGQGTNIHLFIPLLAGAD